ncbi:MAG: PEGA domain-containing protein [Myxococcales bacterium]
MRVTSLLVGLALLAGCDRPRAAATPPPPSLADGLAETSLEVLSTPDGAEVFVDGSLVPGRTPVKLQVKTGREHVVEVRRPGHLAARRTVFAAPHEPLTVELNPQPGAVVKVATVPEGAEVRVAGLAPFRAPGVSDALGPGRHLVEIALEGHVVERREVVVESPGELDLGALTLRPASVVAVRTEPPGAAIRVDGADAHVVTPAEIAVEAQKPHRVEVRLQGYGEQWRKVAAKAAGERQELTFTLERATAIELRRRIGALQAELDGLERRLQASTAKQAKFIVDGSAAAELKREREARALEARIVDVQAELDAARDELSVLQESP